MCSAAVTIGLETGQTFAADSRDPSECWMTRALILMLDSLGVGASADANRFGDAGADTFGHIAESAANGAANREGLRQGSSW